MHGRLQLRFGFVVLLAALWCADKSGVLPLFLLAAAVHEGGHLAVLCLTGGQSRRLVLNASGAVLLCHLPPDSLARAAVCLAGPAASLLLTAGAGYAGFYRLAGASALLGLFNLLPLPPLDGGMALFHLAHGRFPLLRRLLALTAALALLSAGIWLYRQNCGIWLLLTGTLICGQTLKNLAKNAI